MKVGGRESTETFLRNVSEAARQGKEWLVELGMEHSIDEVALLLPEGREGDDWFNMMLDRVGKRGITYFNRSEDTVTVTPLPSQYRVRYDFFNTDLGSVRLELLRLREGHSPLHHLYGLKDSRPRDAAIVHASFKVASNDELHDTFVALSAAGWQCGQYCSSAYGRFGYWRKPADEAYPGLWLKPRVNLQLSDLDDELALIEDDEEEEEEDI